MKKIIYLLSLLLLFSSLFQAQNNASSPGEILGGLQKLKIVGSVLYIAAHPDDENTRLLSYMASERKIRTGYLSITRGDGGQNLIGKEQGDALGLIRTQELLAARRTDGAEQFFTRANDFGYSKNPEETFAIWNKDSILSDVVWIIRNFKPEVIICRFPTTGEGGHGHHTASAILALEAFDAAADPKRFPEQLAYTDVWQAKRIFWNTFNFGTTNTTAPNQIKVDMGVYDPLLGKSIGEIAAESRSNHKSQGFGVPRSRGSSIEYFKQLKGDSVKTDLFEGLDQNIDGTGNLHPEFTKAIDAIIKKYNPAAPEGILPDLIDLRKMLIHNSNRDSYLFKRKCMETDNLIAACAGLWIEASTTDYMGIPGNKISMNLQIIKRNNCEVSLEHIQFINLADTVTSLPLKTNEMVTMKHNHLLPADMPWSNPYWLNEKHEVNRYVVKDPLMIGRPENTPAFSVIFHLKVGDLPLSVERPLVYKYTDPVKGEIYRPFEVLPPATVNISDKVYAFMDANPKTVEFTVKANTPGTKGSLSIVVPEGWTAKVKNPDFTLNLKGDEATVYVLITPGKTPVNGKLSVSLTINGATYSKSIRRIEYDHIPYQFILSDAEASLVYMQLKKTGTNIGYIPGAGDDIPACLKQIGYNVTELNDDMLATQNLSKYSAIITGVRAYNTNKHLQALYDRLMDYVKSGGNLIVQYNTNNQLGSVPSKIGPYPFTITRDRVTDEKAEVVFLKADHPVLNSPNKITPADFEGWVQERGIYFASAVDKSYETIFSMHDPGEKENEGSLIIGKYGKGNFVYTGIVFFRELPAGVPGAYRLMANLLSLPNNK